MQLFFFPCFPSLVFATGESGRVFFLFLGVLGAAHPPTQPVYRISLLVGPPILSSRSVFLFNFSSFQWSWESYVSPFSLRVPFLPSSVG